MSMSITLQQYLEQQDISYELVPHRHTESSMNAAGSAHIPAAKIAKPVILEDQRGKPNPWPQDGPGHGAGAQASVCGL